MRSDDHPTLLPPRKEMERAFLEKDSSYDGIFFAAVRTTGIFCKASCPSKPKMENTEFFASIRECYLAGYRPCKRCTPLRIRGERPEWVDSLMERVATAGGGRIGVEAIRSMGLTPERVRRWFLQNLGMTFSEWCRGQRLAGAFDRLREGMKIEDTAGEYGWESNSGFREAFARVFGGTPGQMRGEGDRIVATLIESPIGPLLSAATERGICLLEFTDPRMLETNLGRLKQRFKKPVVPGGHQHLEQLRSELVEYFAGSRRDFLVPVDLKGTSFQNLVWSELKKIPFGSTLSYEELAQRTERPTARRAVANANGQNPVAILIPCHRVVGKDGTLTGYGGGLWRKRLLLELERRGKLPGQGMDENRTE